MQIVIILVILVLLIRLFKIISKNGEKTSNDITKEEYLARIKTQEKQPPVINDINICPECRSFNMPSCPYNIMYSTSCDSFSKTVSVHVPKEIIEEQWRKPPAHYNPYNKPECPYCHSILEYAYGGTNPRLQCKNNNCSHYEHVF
jgi:hypothetical protein